MARREARELTVEEFNEWNAATTRMEAVGKAADEEGGPSLSLVPALERNEVWPTDLLPPADPEPHGPSGAETGVTVTVHSTRLLAVHAHSVITPV